MLTLENISKSIKTKKIVDGISFDIKPGTINGLLGPNGAGKTTTFYLIAGLVKCDKGKIIFDSKDITSLPMHKRSKIGIKYWFNFLGSQRIIKIDHKWAKNYTKSVL